MTHASDFWDALAPHLAAVEDNFLDRASIRRIFHEIDSPVLVVGAGQGLIVAELLKNGFQCDGLDFSSEMAKYAKLRRGITLVQADAKAMPLPDRTYATIIYATGVIDFTGDGEAIRSMLAEGRRVVKDSGKIFIAFYKASAAQERFMATVGLLHTNEMAFRESLELYLLNPAQTIAWIVKRTGLSYLQATLQLFRMATGASLRELRTTFKMQRIVREFDDPRSLINAAPQKLPFRNEAEIGNLFRRLGIPVKQLRALKSCVIVRI